MITEVVMPQMGADMKEGTLLRWIKQEGEQVNRGEIIAEIETDKANVEIESFGSGVLRKAIRHEGDVVPVGELIAVVAAPEDDISQYEAAGAPVAPTSAPPAQTQVAEEAPAPASAPAAAAPPSDDAAESADAHMRVSPVARRLAEEEGVDLSTIKGSGPDGRILRRDIEAAKSARAPAPPAAAPAPPPTPAPSAPAPASPVRPVAPEGEDVVTDVPLSRIRQTIARRMTQSKQEAPHYYLAVDIEMDAALKFAEDAQKYQRSDQQITVNHVVVLATARALAQHPKLNAYWVDNHVQLHSQINVGIAVALDDGLVAPAVLDAGHKGLAQLAEEARSVGYRARNGSLRPEEYTSATFSISNIGPFGVEFIVPIVTPPQVGVLGVGAAKPQAVVRDGQVVVRTMMTCVLSADHRATDGADGARFLATLRQLLENPGLMLL